MGIERLGPVGGIRLVAYDPPTGEWNQICDSAS